MANAMVEYAPKSNSPRYGPWQARLTTLLAYAPGTRMTCARAHSPVRDLRARGLPDVPPTEQWHPTTLSCPGRCPRPHLRGFLNAAPPMGRQGNHQ